MYGATGVFLFALAFFVAVEAAMAKLETVRDDLAGGSVECAQSLKDCSPFFTASNANSR